MITMMRRMTRLRHSVALPRPSLLRPSRALWQPSRAASTVSFSFLKADGTIQEVTAPHGATLLEVTQDNGIDEVEGACEGACACSTCHMIFDEDTFAALPERSEDEEDMLDLAAEVEDTSRLGCQVEVSDVLEGKVVRLPKEVFNQMDDL